MTPISWTSGSLTNGSKFRFEHDETTLLIEGLDPCATGGYWQSAPIPVVPRSVVEIATAFDSTSTDGATSARALVQWRADDLTLLGVDYLLPREDDPSRLALAAEPPPDAAEFTITLLATHIGKARVRWGAPLIATRPGAPLRRVTVASARLPANLDGTIESNLGEIVATLASTAARRPDIVCLPEMCASWGVNGSPREVAIARDVIVTQLARGALASRANVAAAFYEASDDGHIYNTALLLDRQGHVIGEYRKTHLTTLEMLTGVQPGRTLDVFQTDVGRIAMMICWDMWYPEPIRLASLKGADIVLWPYEQDRHVLHRQVTPPTRAMDSGVVIVGASQVGPAPIIDDDGNTLAELDTDQPAYATVAIGGPLRGSRWPQSPPAHQNRRNLTTGERSVAISDAIARLNRPT